MPTRPSRSALTIGMPPATAASKAEDRAALLGQRRQLGAVHGDQRLVGGDDMLAGAQRRLDQALGDAARAADQLDDDVDVRRRGQRQRVVFPAQPREIDVALLGLERARDGHELEPPAAAQRQQAVVLGEQLTTPAPTVPRPAMPILRG